MPADYFPMYCRIAARKFFFFCDPHRRGKACIKKLLLSNCLQELMELHQFLMSMYVRVKLEGLMLVKWTLKAFWTLFWPWKTDTSEGLTYIFKSIDLQGRGNLTTPDIYTLFSNIGD
ncbi:hypothetical protein OPV22_012052 [Ensete ventricosum]|uniref:EF-hand domain-containing protein n=1 Tax=Ensete ventricosum TaxID=4639 RepID=A0AAV8R1Q2_ENSVE|nr:hypothetical protein OPV22_012052 [Ensete ventricosum]